jgi:hypothetical protein
MTLLEFNTWGKFDSLMMRGVAANSVISDGDTESMMGKLSNVGIMYTFKEST